MPDKIFTNNQVSISGTVVSKFEFSHEVYGEGFYVVDLLVPRLSDTYDTIPLMISERLIDVTKQSFFEGIKFAKWRQVVSSDLTIAMKSQGTDWFYQFL